MSDVQSAFPLRVMVRDPLWLFAYWSQNHEDIQAALNLFEPTERNYIHWCLRVEKGRGENVTDIAIELSAGNWYLRVAPGCEYQLSLVAFPPDRQGIVVLAGNPVVTPPLGVCQGVDPEWSIDEETFFRIFSSSLLPAKSSPTGGVRHYEGGEWKEDCSLESSVSPSHSLKIPGPSSHGV